MKNNFERFITIAWFCLGAGIWLQFFQSQMSILESGLFASTVILALYPFTTYLSKVLLIKSVRKKRFTAFGLKALILSTISALLIVAQYYLFEYLEDIEWFSHSLLCNSEDTLLHDFTGAIFSVLFINFGFCGLRFFQENMRLQKILLDSKLQILQAQINPHFMFNVLNHVNVLMRREPDLASDLLVKYTNILRYQLYNTKKEFVDLRQEINFMEDFIEIEKVRWKNNLTVEYLWDINDFDKAIPPLLFITFLENAFKHVSRSKKEKGFVKITLKQKNNKLILHLINSKFVDIEDQKNKTSGIGLANIKERLDILFPGNYSLEIDQSTTLYTTSLTLNIQ